MFAGTKFHPHMFLLFRPWTPFQVGKRRGPIATEICGQLESDASQKLTPHAKAMPSQDPTLRAFPGGAHRISAHPRVWPPKSTPSGALFGFCSHWWEDRPQFGGLDDLFSPSVEPTNSQVIRNWWCFIGGWGEGRSTL